MVNQGYPFRTSYRTAQLYPVRCNKMLLLPEKFKLLLKNTGVSCYGVALDFWKNDMTGDNYLGVWLHFVTKYSLCRSNLATRLFNEKKTGPAVVEYVRSVLNEYDISQSADIVFVTDNASNMVKAFENELHLRCACHCLNLAIGQALFIDELGETLASCRKLVQHFKQPGLSYRKCKHHYVLKHHYETNFYPTVGTNLGVQRLNEY